MEEILGRRLAAEVVGTAILVLFGAGSVVAALRLGDGELDYAGLGMVAIAFALAIAIAIYAFGPTSGAHINPAASGPLTGGSLNPARTFGPMLVTGIGGGDASWGDLPAYIVGPLLGGLVAAFAYDLIARPRALEEVAPAPLGDGEGRPEPAVPARAAGPPPGKATT